MRKLKSISSGIIVKYIKGDFTTLYIASCTARVDMAILVLDVHDFHVFMFVENFSTVM